MDVSSSQKYRSVALKKIIEDNLDIFQKRLIFYNNWAVESDTTTILELHNVQNVDDILLHNLCVWGWCDLSDRIRARVQLQECHDGWVRWYRHQETPLWKRLTRWYLSGKEWSTRSIDDTLKNHSRVRSRTDTIRTTSTLRETVTGDARREQKRREWTKYQRIQDWWEIFRQTQKWRDIVNSARRTSSESKHLRSRHYEYCMSVNSKKNNDFCT